MAYKVLADLMLGSGVSCLDISELLGVGLGAVADKLSERLPMTLDEARAIRAKFFPASTLDCLFASDGNVASERERDVASVDALREIVDGAGLMNGTYDAILREMREERMHR